MSSYNKSKIATIHDSNILFTKEFVAKSNEIIKPPFEHGYHTISSTYLAHARLERKAHNDKLAEVLDLASDICSMMLQPNSTNDPFKPLKQYDGKRTAIADDFTSKQLEFIANVYLSLEEPLVKARFSDLLWLCINPRKIEFVRSAIKSYLMLPIAPEIWVRDIGNCWERCVQLALQIRDSDSVSKIEDSLLSAFKKEYPDGPFMHLWIARIIDKNRLCVDQQEFITDSLFESASSLRALGDYSSARKYLSLLEGMYKARGKESNRLECLVLTADCFELEGDSLAQSNTSNQIAANSIYGDALHAYRKVPVVKRDDLGVTAKLETIRDKITDSGTASLSEMSLITTPGIDISAIIDDARKHVGQKDSLELSLLFYTGFKVPKFQELKALTIDQMQQSPISNLFGINHIAGDGRVVAKTPALNINGADEGNAEVVFNKTIQNFQFDIQLIVDGQISPGLNQILSEFRVTKDYLRQLCYQSPIVPESRENLMASALWSGFEHDFCNGIHMLVPQFEHLVRTLFKKSGIRTSNTDTSGIENENGLSTLLNHERATEVLDEDLLFEIKAVFTESIGPNLRNEVAHGLLGDQVAGSTASIYAWWLVLRLVVRSLYEHETSSYLD